MQQPTDPTTPTNISDQTQNPLANQSDQLKESAVQQQKDLTEASRLMFSKISDYLKGELEATSEDFKLLEAMNHVTTDRYKETATLARGLTAFMQDLQNKYGEFDPYLKKIEQIDNNVSELERTVMLLDDYTKRLEEKFKKLAIQKKEAKKAIKS